MANNIIEKPSISKAVITVWVFLFSVMVYLILWIILSSWFGLAGFFLIFGSYFLQALKRIESDPPHKGMVTYLGKRVKGMTINEGWNFLPIYPYLYGYIPIEVREITMESRIIIRTPDLAECEVPISLTFIPEDLEQYITSGKEAGVREQLNAKIDERIREWTTSKEEGPNTWEELYQSRLEGISILLKKIADDSIQKLEPEEAQDVPTWIWIRFYTKPQPTRFLKNEEDWVKDNWKKVRDVIEKIGTKYENAGIKKLEESVSARRRQVEVLRIGKAEIELKDLGISMKRLNLGEIKVLGQVAVQAEKEAKEEQERKGEALEMRYVIERIAQLMEKFKYTKEQALEIIQTERGKVPKEIKEHKISIDQSLIGVLSPIAQELVKKWEKGGKS